MMKDHPTANRNILLPFHSQFKVKSGETCDITCTVQVDYRVEQLRIAAGIAECFHIVNLYVDGEPQFAPPEDALDEWAASPADVFSELNVISPRLECNTALKGELITLRVKNVSKEDHLFIAVTLGTQFKWPTLAS